MRTSRNASSRESQSCGQNVPSPAFDQVLREPPLRPCRKMRSATASPSGSNTVVRPNGPLDASYSSLSVSVVSLLVKYLLRNDLFERDLAFSDTESGEATISSALWYFALDSSAPTRSRAAPIWYGLVLLDGDKMRDADMYQSVGRKLDGHSSKGPDQQPSTKREATWLFSSAVAYRKVGNPAG